MALTRTAKNVAPLVGAIVRANQQWGEEVEPGELVYLNDDGKWYLARTNAAATSRATGMVASVNDAAGGILGAADDYGDVCVFGPMAGFTDMSEDQLIWVSSGTAGASTQTEPSGAGTWSHSTGYPLASDVYFFLPEVEAPNSNS